MLKPTVILIISSIDFQPKEYRETRQALINEKIGVVTVSDKQGYAKATDGTNAKVDLVLQDVEMDKYDAVFIIGGPGALDHLNNERVWQIVKKANKLGKKFGAICISPRILAQAGVLKGHQATGWNDDYKLDNIFKKNNVIYNKDKQVVVDENIITATGPDVAEQFGKEIAKLIKKAKNAGNACRNNA